MKTKDIKDKIHTVLFPSKARLLENTINEKETLFRERNSVSNQLIIYKDALEKEKGKPKATLGDLMRENLGILPVSFSKTETGGLPKHFLDTSNNKGLHDQYIAQLHQIWNLEVWHAMIENLIDAQGNYTLRHADGEVQILAGRMTINGLSLLRDEVYKGHIEYADRSKPPEEYDKFSVDLIDN